MSNTKVAPVAAPQEKPKAQKTVGYRLLSVLILAACVSVFFLPLNVFTGNYGLEKLTIIDIVKKLLASETKLFGFLPTLIDYGVVIRLAITAALYVFAVALVIAIITSFIAIFSKKSAPRRATVAVYFLTWGAAIYALSVLVASDYLNTVSITFDIITIAIAAVGAIFYFILMLAKLGKFAWVNAIEFILSLAVTAFVIIAMTNNGQATAEAIKGGGLQKWLLIGVVALMFVNLFISTLRAFSKRALAFDLVRYLIVLLLSLGVCYIEYSLDMANSTFLLFTLVAAGISLIQVIIVVFEMMATQEKKVVEAKKEVVSDFETEEYVEAYEYEGGPIAGIQLAEEVTPTQAAQERLDEGILRNGPVAGYNFYNTKSFDPFIGSLDDAEREEFTDIYILKCKGYMPEIPEYVVGGDNKEFFNKVFIYLGQYRDKIPSNLLNKMYKFSMKLS